MPNWKHIVREHLAVLRLPPEREIEIVEELALCFEAVYEDALAAGLSEAEAEARAVRGYDWRLLECELSRTEQPLAARALRPSLELIGREGGIRMESFIQDLRFGARTLLKSKGFTAVAVLSLALGIGANTAIFSLLDAVLLKMLPVKNPEQLVFLETDGGSSTGKRRSDLSYDFYQRLRQRTETLAGVCTFSNRAPLNVLVGDQAEVAQVQQVSGGYFAVLGVNAITGRTLADEDDKIPGGHPVAVISYNYWQRRFARDPAIVGKALVIAQVALSLLLLVGAGLFVRTLANLRSVEMGFQAENVLIFSADPRMLGYDGRRIADLYQRMLERLKTIPGALQVSLSRDGLLSRSGYRSSVYAPGRAPREGENPSASDKRFSPNHSHLHNVGPDYFATVGLPILRGRGFTEQDNERAPAVAVVSETFARYYFGAEDPVGKRFGRSPEESDRIEIVGLVKDTKYNSLRQQILRTFYVPYLQNPASWRETNFQIRVASDPKKIIPAVREAAQMVEPRLPIYNVKTLAEQVDASIVQERLIGALSGFFGLVALALAAIGLYGLMAYSVAQRTHGIGIRMALGARAGDALKLIIRQGMLLVALGAAAGLVTALNLTRLVSNQLFGVQANDPLTFASVALLLAIVALAACWIPARRAAKTDPLAALRHE
jgi:hypothetical protein